MSNFYFPYEEAKIIVKKQGFNEWLRILKNEFPEKDLFKVSTNWITDQHYGCKAKGTKGDLLVIWK